MAEDAVPSCVVLSLSKYRSNSKPELLSCQGGIKVIELVKMQGLKSDSFGFMLKFSFTFTLFFLSSFGAKSQTEGWIYCFNVANTISVNKVSETQSGDSIIKVFSEDYTNTQFELLYLHDTIYSKFNGSYYFLGTDHPSIGDIWHPMRCVFMSFQDSSVWCPNPMNLEVTAVSQVTFGNETVNVVQLMDLDITFNPTHEYVEGIGMTVGGPLCNLRQQFPCDPLFDAQEPFFRSFTRDSALYEGQYTCPPLSVLELELNDKHLIKILDVLGRETEESTNELQIHVYSDGSTRKVFKVD
jgi:hypothetical protein